MIVIKTPITFVGEWCDLDEYPETTSLRVTKQKQGLIDKAQEFLRDTIFEFVQLNVKLSKDPFFDEQWVIVYSNGWNWHGVKDGVEFVESSY